MNEVMELEGVVQFFPFAVGSKSESIRPYLVQKDGTRTLLYKKDDNPFENKGLTGYQNQWVRVQGAFSGNCFHVNSIITDCGETENLEEENELL